MKEVFRTNLINEYMKEKGLSKTQFCKECKINIVSLNKILTNDFDIDLKVIFKICKILKTPVHLFFENV